jgi:uncharacterized protein YqeY
VTTQPLRVRLRTELTPAMRARDTVAITAIRSALAAIDNAEAVPGEELRTSTGDGPIAGARLGLGAGEAQRRELTEQDVADIVGSEISGRLTAATEVEQAGRPDHGERLRAEAAVLESFVRP